MLEIENVTVTFPDGRDRVVAQRYAAAIDQIYSSEK